MKIGGGAAAAAVGRAWLRVCGVDKSKGVDLCHCVGSVEHKTVLMISDISLSICLYQFIYLFKTISLDSRSKVHFLGEPTRRRGKGNYQASEITFTS